MKHTVPTLIPTITTASKGNLDEHGGGNQKGPGRSRKQQAIIPNPSTTNIENNDAQMTET